MTNYLVPLCIVIVVLLLVLAWIVHTVDRVRPWWQQKPTRRQIKAWRRNRTITIVPNRKRANAE